MNAGLLVCYVLLLYFQMLSVLPSSIMRCEMLEKIEHTDPFCGYPDVIRALKAKEEDNVKS